MTIHIIYLSVVRRESEMLPDQRNFKLTSIHDQLHEKNFGCKERLGKHDT